MKEKWNSLSDVKEWIEKNTQEEILSFNGYLLETNKAVYGLSHGKLSVRLKD